MFDFIYRHYTNTQNWDNSTLNLYILLFIFAGVLGYFSQRAKSLVVHNQIHIESEKKIRSEYLFILFILLVSVAGLRTIGTDYFTYKDIFNYSTTKYSGDFSVEPGFLFLNILIASIGINFEGAIFLFSFFTLFFVFEAIKQYGKEIIVYLAVMAYVALYYFPGFNMLRMYLAASITLYSFKFLIDNKIKKFFLWCLVALLIHYSAIFFMFPVLGLMIFKKNRKLFWLLFFLVWILSFKIVSVFSELTLIDRWMHYGVENYVEKSSGMLHWIINIPLIVLYLYSQKKIPSNKYLPSLIIFTVCELLIGLLSYKISILGRSLVYYNVLFIIVLPIIINDLVKRHTRWNKIVKLIFIIYLSYRFYLYLSEYLYLDGIMPYKMIKL